MADFKAEPWIRFCSFAGVFLLLALGEWLLPRRPRHAHTGWRWSSNLALVALNTLTVRLIAPLGAVTVALLADEHEWGVFRRLDLPEWLVVMLAVVALDLAIYLQHVLFHAVPLLWRLHRVHHADLDLDVTTGLRFHTIEILLSLGIKLAVVAALGTPALAVLIFEVLLNATSMFNHANLRLPRPLDRLLRLVLVTPDMHRVHHSWLRAETNSNYGFNLPWWDFLFGTYTPQPAAGHEGMTIGVAEFRDERQVDRLPGMLLLPLAREQPTREEKDQRSKPLCEEILSR